MVAIGEVFTERRLYRPGETAFVKGYFRSPSPHGLVTPAGSQATVEGVDDREHVIFSQTVTLDAFGSFSCTMPIPMTAHRGRGLVRARMGVAASGGATMTRRQTEPSRRRSPSTSKARWCPSA